MTALFLVSTAALVDRCSCTGYLWQPFGQRPPDIPPPAPQSFTPHPSPPEEKPGCVGESAPKADKKEDKKEVSPGTSEPIVGFPTSPFSGFPPSQKIPIPAAFYQGLKGGPLAGFQIQPVPDKGAMSIAVLTDVDPSGPPVPPPKSYPVVSKGGVLKGWRVAPLARPIVLQQIALPVKSKSFQAVSPKGAIVVQNSPSVWNISSKGGLSYIAV